MRGAGGPSGGNSIQQRLGSGTLTCRPRDLKGVQHDTDPLPTQGVVVTSLTRVGKRATLLENSVPSSGITNQNASKWRVNQATLETPSPWTGWKSELGDPLLGLSGPDLIHHPGLSSQAPLS